MSQNGIKEDAYFQLNEKENIKKIKLLHEGDGVGDAIVFLGKSLLFGQMKLVDDNIHFS